MQLNLVLCYANDRKHEKHTFYNLQMSEQKWTGHALICTVPLGRPYMLSKYLDYKTQAQKIQRQPHISEMTVLPPGPVKGKYICYTLSYSYLDDIMEGDVSHVIFGLISHFIVFITILTCL